MMLRTVLIATAAMGVMLSSPLAEAQGPPTTKAPTGAAIAPSEPRQLGGIWESERFHIFVSETSKLPHTKAMTDGYAAAMKSGQILQTAWTSCRPGAFSAMSMVMHSIAVIQTETDITISFEEPRMTRRIRLNSKHPENITPSYVGDSIGHWEGNTLVVDTIGFNGNFELDAAAQPTSAKMHTVERFTKSADGKKVSIEITITDPEYYSAPFTIQRGWVSNSARHQMEYDCTENPRAEEFEHTFFVKDLYRPTCQSFQGEGMAPSRMICESPKDPSAR
jgi:hypothetical protein